MNTIKVNSFKRKIKFILKKRKKFKNNGFSKLLKQNYQSKDHLLQDYISKKDFPSAIKLCKEIIIKEKGNFIIRNILAEIYLSLSINLDESIELLKKSIEIKPNYFKSLNSMGICLRNKGRIEESIEFFEKAISFKPDFELGFFNIALSYKSLNNSERAILNYQKALKFKPDFLEALNNLGNIFCENKKYNEALDLFKKAIEIKPDFDLAHNNIGIIYNEIGNLESALFHYKKAIKINSNNPEAFNNLGNIYKKLGNNENAKNSYKNALKLNSRSFDAKNNLGIILMDEEEYNNAKNLFEEVINQSPNFYQAYSNLANLYRRLGNHKKAYEFNNLSIKIQPNNPSAINNIGLILMDENQVDLAIEQFLKGINLNASDDLLNNLGLAYQRKYEFTKSIDQYKLSLIKNPNNAKTYCNLGICYKEQKEFIKALEAFNTALNIKPDNLFALTQKLSSERHICLWDSDSNLNKLNFKEHSYEQNIDPRSIMYLADNPELEMIIARNYFSKNFKRESKKIMLVNKKKIRVGYFSADFVTHAATVLIVRLFEIYNSDSYEIYAYSFGNNNNDEYTERIKKGVTHFKDLRDKNDSQIVEIARDDQIDIAVDLMGYTKNCRPAIFSLRVAPIQISFLGFTGTMGTKCMDYIIADKILIKETEKNLYDEKIIYLKKSPLCFDDTLKINENKNRSDFNLPLDGFLFACFNNSYKISSIEFDIWMNILNKVENSYLWLFASNKKAKDNLILEAEKRNINPERIIFAERLSLKEHFNRQYLANLFLDTFNHNAGCTGVLALKGKLPILTLYGKSYHSRMSSSLLHYLGLDELITFSKEEYFKKALQLALDKEYYLKLKNKLVYNLQNNEKFNSKFFVEELENNYLNLVNNLRKDKLNK